MRRWGATMQGLVDERRASGAADAACEVPEAKAAG
jgi:hypothetical protein